jgi:ATP-dependent Clp protease ATP-binding subunit ClpC
MPSIEFDIVAVTRISEEDRYLGEVLLFPDIGCYGDDLTRLHNVLRKRVQKEVEKVLPLELHKRLLPAAPHLRQIGISVEPPVRSPAWREPVTLVFHVVQWRHGDRPYIAYVPALGIETIVSHEEELEKQLEVDIRFALVRKGISASLQGLLPLSRYRDMRIDTLSLQVTVQTPKQRAAADTDKPSKQSGLLEVATDMVQLQRPPAFELEDVLLHMADSLTAAKPGSILLVGPSGVGKTAAIGVAGRPTPATADNWTLKAEMPTAR